MKNAVEALLSLPYYSFAANQKLCYIVVFVCFLATCPDKYELHEKCCDAIAFVTGKAVTFGVEYLLHLEIFFFFMLE